jgi:hypothetical protein
MKFRHYAFISMFFSASVALGQWTTSGNDIQNSNTGRVGVGLLPSTDFLFQVRNTGTGTVGAVSVVDTRTSGTVRGIDAGVNSPNGSGVFGVNLASTGPGVGVYGRSFASNGFGIYGFTGSSETAVAGGFQTDRASGTGVSIRGTATSGTGRALDIIQSSSGGFSLFATGGSAHIGSNLGLGSGNTAPTAALDVNGSVRLRNQTASSSARFAVGLDLQGNVSTLPIGGIGGVQEFSGAGTTIWTVPPNVTRVRVQVWGAGGGGNSVGTGGSGGFVDAALSVFPGEQWILTRGAGGTGVIGSGAAGAGGSSSITPNTFGPPLPPPVYVASGGTGATSGGSGAGGGTTPATISGGITRAGVSGIALPICIPNSYFGPRVDFCPINATPVHVGWGGASTVTLSVTTPQGFAGAPGHIVITW